MTEPRVGLKRGYYILNTDGGMASGHGRRRSGDPLGHAAIGALLRTPRLVTVDQISKPIGLATHNEAEYQALIEGLKLARDHGIERIRVYADSELVVDQVNGISAVKEPRLIEPHTMASSLLALFKSIRICWVPRAMNAEADRLVRHALGALLEAQDNTEPGQQKPEPRQDEPEPRPKPKPKPRKAAWWTSLPDAEKAAHLLAHRTISDRTWTEEPRLKGEQRDSFIRRILLGETGESS